MTQALVKKILNGYVDSMITKIRRIWGAHKREQELRLRERVLLDRLQQIEWRLAMCRSCATDVNIAHAIAFDTLAEMRVEPRLTSAVRYNIRRAGAAAT